MALRVAVIGSHGFVGSALLRRLIASDGVRVTALARPQFDLQKSETFGQIPADTDVIVHAAGAVGAGPGRAAQDFWDNNVISTHALVTHLNARQRRPWLLYLSTGAVNGGATGVVADNVEPRPEGTYALTKYLAEEVIRKTYKGAWAIARLYFPYGPGQADSRLIPGLVRKVRCGEPVTLNLGGHPLISPVFIDDLVAYLERMLRARPVGIHNVAGASRVLIADIVAMIEAELGERAIIHESGLVVPDFCAHDCLGPGQTPLQVGLATTLQFCRE